MAFPGTIASRALMDLLTSTHGVGFQLAERIQIETLPAEAYPSPQVYLGHTTVEVWDKVVGARHCQIAVYCERIRNTMTEKFRSFSGEVDLVIETRVSMDRMEALEMTTQLYLESVLEVLRQSRGEWRDGVYQSGRYEVKLEPVKHGGKNFTQVAKVVVPVDVHLN